MAATPSWSRCFAMVALVTVLCSCGVVSGTLLEKLRSSDVKSECDRDRFQTGISKCEVSLKPLDGLIKEKKTEEACAFLKTYMSCVEEYELFLSCERDPLAKEQLDKVSAVIAKNQLTCPQLSALVKISNIQKGAKPPSHDLVGKAHQQKVMNKAGAPAKCNDRKLMRVMVDCLKSMKQKMETLMVNRRANQKEICAETEVFKSCVNGALSHSECQTDEEVTDQTMHFATSGISEYRWACKEILAPTKKCEDRALITELNKCVRAFNKTMEPITDDRENNKEAICKAGDTFLQCVNEGVSGTDCRDDSEVIYHTTHFADKILKQNKWSCEKSKNAASPKSAKTLEVKDSASLLLRNLSAKEDLDLGNTSASLQIGSSKEKSGCMLEAVRLAVDSCQQTAYDTIKKKGITQPKHLCAELKGFKDCSIKATAKHNCAADKTAETYIYDRVKDSFYKYLTDCRPLWSAASVDVSSKTLTLVVSVLSVLLSVAAL